MKIRFAFVLSSVAALALAGCAAYTSGPSASAKLEPTRGNTTAGTVTFVQSGDVVKVSGSISGLKPNAEHGFHVHEKGDCSSGAVMTTGAPFTPAGKSRGHHGMADHPTGGLPSLKADANGVGSFSFES